MLRLSLALLAILVPAPAAVAQSDADSSGAEPAPSVAGLAGDYVVGISDVLRISVWGETETGLDRQVRVRPDGKISFPLVNDIKVAGLSPEEIRNLVANRLTEYIRDPHVAVVVEQINSFTVYVLGEVNQQGPMQFERPTRLLQALASAGGLNQFAKRQIIIIREQNGVETRMAVDYRKLFAGATSEVNIFLQPGDTILVN
jgi:polysaccharide export outer membrane protein